ncbi:single-stranded DNA-binding protein [Azotobacter vinelandii]|uniref:single-stranded DNA-binding protein n=1 Tax=Azotobacter vinelandii TaxID=354 RepID=UPI000917EBCA|nr:single-stranded DNA-binding protein [Azotobacter vinelandii]WKN23200.1 single-stranded DNA-binding protein [Azotobacter vinelandii]SFY08926.1 single-strand DNA-binding protein [Azotobacter vinelandii]
MATPVNWEGNIGSAPEYKQFANGNKEPRRMLRLNVFFDNSIPDGQGGYKDRGGFWCNVEWWHPDAERYAQLFMRGMRVLVQGRTIMDRWEKNGEADQALKVEASRIAILPHRLEHVAMRQSDSNGHQPQQRAPRAEQRAAEPASAGIQDYDGFDDDIPM